MSHHYPASGSYPATKSEIPLTGVVVAGGKGTRLHPFTDNINKHLLPVDGRRMIDYVIDAFLKAGCDEIVVVTSEEARLSFEQGLIKDLNELGMPTRLVVQTSAPGISGALRDALEAVRNERCVFFLGDCVLLAPVGIYREIGRRCRNLPDNGAMIGGHRPGTRVEQMGNIHLNADGTVEKVVEKPPIQETTGLCANGLYGFSVPLAKKRLEDLRPSARGELEISDLMSNMIVAGDRVELINLGSQPTITDRGILIDEAWNGEEEGSGESWGRPSGSVWHDAGTAESLLEASLASKRLRTAGLGLFGRWEIGLLERGLVNENTLRDHLNGKPECDYKAELLKLLDLGVKIGA